jgi:hypothetical protein
MSTDERIVDVFYSAVARRWEISQLGYDDVDIVDLDDGEGRPVSGVRVGRSAGQGAVVLIVDLPEASSDVPRDALDLALRQFGPSVVELLGTAQPDDLEVRLVAPDSAVPARADALAAALPGEPGIPQRKGTGTGLEVPTPFGAAQFERRPGEIVVDLDPATPDSIWIRVSDAADGDLIALGRATDHVGGTRVAVVFGLELDPDELHISLTDEPLRPIGSRDERRRQWIDELLDQATGAVLSEPVRAQILAEQAQRLAEQVADRVRSDRAGAVAGLASASIRRRRLRWIWVPVTLLVLAALAALVGLLVLDADSGSSDSTRPIDSGPLDVAAVAPSATDQGGGPTTPVITSGASTVSVASVPPTIPASTIPAPSGRSLYVLGPDATMGATLLGLATVRAGESVEVLMQLTLTLPHVYGGVSEQDARLTCRSAKGMRVTTETVGGDQAFRPVEVDVYLTSSNPSSTVTVGIIENGVQSAMQSVIPGECDGPTRVFDGETLIDADTTFVRDPERVTIALPDGLMPGMWRLDLGSADRVAATASPLILTILP